MKSYLRIVCGILIVYVLSGCATLSPSDKDLLRQQKLNSELNYTDEVQKLASHYTQVQVDEIQIIQNDGNVSKGIFVKHDKAERTILYFGPNNHSILKQHKNVLPFLTQLNANVIWFDYRGFGFTSGIASFEVLKSDAQHIYKTLNGRIRGPLVLHGLSIGSILAIDVASSGEVEQLVIEGSITNVKDWIDYSFVAQAYYSYGLPKPVGYLIKPFFRIEPSPEIAVIDNPTSLSKHKGSLLMLSGANDWETPPALSKKLYDSIAQTEPGEFHIIDSVGHLNMLTNETTIEIYKHFLATNTSG